MIQPPSTQSCQIESEGAGSVAAATAAADTTVSVVATAAVLSVRTVRLSAMTGICAKIDIIDWFLRDCCFISTNCLLEAEIEGVADEGVAYRHFVEIGYVMLEICEIVEVEVVAGVDAEAYIMGGAAGFGIRSHGCGGIGGILVGVRLGVELDAVSAGLSRCDDLGGYGVYENRGPDAGVLEALDDRGEEIEVGLDVPAVVRRQGVGSVGHEGDLLGTHLEDEVDEFGRGIAFDVEFGSDERAESEDVIAADVALVGARMNCDALSAEAFAVDGHVFDAGTVFAAGVAQSSDFVDVDAKIGHCYFLNLSSVDAAETENVG